MCIVHSVGRVSTPMSPNPAHPKETSLTASSTHTKETSLSTHSTSPPTTSPISPNPSQKVLGPRRTAGSSIMTSTTFDRPYIRKPQKPTTEGEENGKAPQNEGDQNGAKQNGDFNASSDSFFAPVEVKSDPESEETTAPQRLKVAKGSKLTKHGSFSFGHSHQTGNKESRLLKPAASKGTTTAEEAESATPPSMSKLKGLLGSKLHAPTNKSKEVSSPPQASSSASSGDAPEETAANDQPDPPSSRLKFPGSGRSTPSNINRSGIQRPSSRLSKSGSSSTNNLTREGVGEEEGTSSKLRLQRKGSDGAAKRHLVNPAMKNLLTGHSMQAGTASSLPRHLPMATLQHSADSTALELSSSTEDEKPAQKDMPPTKGEGLGLRKPTGGLKKPGGSLLSGVRTPNLPSSGPQSSTTTEGKDRLHTTGDVAENSRTPPTENSPSLGKKLMAPKATGASKQFGLKRPTSPSSRLKLHKVTPASEVATSPPKSLESPGKVNLAGSLPPREAELCSSSSSLESSSKDKQESLPSPLQGVESTGQSTAAEDGLGVQSAAGVGGQSAASQGVRVQSVAGVGGQSAAPEEVAPEKLVQLDVSNAESAKEDAVVPPADFKEEEGKDSHLRFGRRISPEGMSHEDVTSPRVEGGSKITPPLSPSKEHHSSSEDAESGGTEKEEKKDIEGHHSRFLASVGADLSSKTQRARSLSPKSSHRLMPKGMSRVRDLEGGLGGGLVRVNSSESTNSSEGTPSLSRKPLKSSLRQKKSRHSSTSSREGVISPTPRHPKVTISPRSSRVRCSSLTNQKCGTG